MVKRRISAFLVFAILLSMFVGMPTVAEAVASTDDTLVQYNFDETNGTTATNSSVTGAVNNATGSAIGLNWSTGKNGGAADLDGTNGYFSLPDGIVTSCSSITISTWVKLDKNDSWTTICTFAQGTSKYMLLHSYCNEGGNAGGVDLVINTGSGEQRVKTGAGTELPIGVWQHVAFTLSGSTGKLYINGVPAATKNDFSVNPSGLGYTTNNYIGKSVFGDPNVDGLIDDFRIYNRALSESEIQSLAGVVVDPTVKHGLKSEYYTSSQGNQDLDELCKITVDSNIAFSDLCPNLKQYTGKSDNTAVRWSGQIQPEFSENYTFNMIGDNGFRLWIDGKLAIDHWATDWDVEQTSDSIALVAGQKYDIKIEFFNISGGAGLKLYWSSPSESKQIVPMSALYCPASLYQDSDLTAYISHVKAILDVAIVGSQPGNYPQSAKDSFAAAVQSASDLVGTNATSDQLEQAIADLKTARDIFKTTVVKEPWDAPGTGNPVLPGYFADPTVFYDDNTDTFYSFATMDGINYNWQRDPHVAVSKDMVTWDIKPVSLPAFWPMPTDSAALGFGLWCPSIMYNQNNKKYYIMYCADMKTYVAYSDSPLGPWTDATKGTTASEAVFLPTLDAQFFQDTDGKSYVIYGGGGNCFISALNFNSDYTISVDNSVAEATEGNTYKYKKITGLSEYNEASELYKKDGKYYLFYSVDGSQKYRVRYATSTSIWGPYTSQPGYVVEKDSVRDILGPGHNSIFDYKGDTYMAYHRQHFPFVDSKRQVCVNKLTFSGDSISLDVQNHSGLRSGTGALETLVANALSKRDEDFAYRKIAKASSISDYKGGTFNGETYSAISGLYKADYAVDDNYGTRWMAGVEQETPSSLIVDLGSDRDIGRTETIFEYVERVYNYKIEYLGASDASSIDAAEAATTWKTYADRTNNDKRQSPVTDVNNVTARYLKITITSANLPASAEYGNPGATDFRNRVSIVEFKVFGNTVNTLSEVIEQAQNMHDNVMVGSEYPAAIKATLQTAINNAILVRDNQATTPEEIKNTITALTAVTQFVSTSNTLVKAIQQAQNMHDNVIEGTRPGEYSLATKATLQAAIDAAKVVKDNAAATQEEIKTALATLNAAATLFINSANPQGTATDLRLQYKFDEATGNKVLNSSYTGAFGDGTLRGNATWSKGLIDGAADLGGSSSDYVQLPNGIVSDLDQLTISMWVKMDRKADWQTMYTFANGQSQYMILTPQGRPGGNPSGISLVIKADSTGEQRISTGAGTELPDGVWKNVTFTMGKNSSDGKYTGILYVDGVSSATKSDFTVTPKTMGNTLNNYIGKSVFDDPNLDGKVDDFRIYSRALDASEVKNIVDEQSENLMNEDKDSLDLGDISAVMSNLTLPLTGANGSTISWTSNDTSIIESNGTVHRPTTEANPVVTLTAKIERSGKSATKEFNVTIISNSDTNNVAFDKLALNLIKKVESNLILPTTGANGSTISWVSSNSLIVEANGTVHRPASKAGNKAVTMTATIQKGNVTATKEFSLLVMEQYAGYVMSYFLDSDQSLVLAYSRDGLHWTALNDNKPVVKATIGSKNIRDPFLLRKQDGKFELIATQGWDNNSLYIFDSEDLINYNNERLVKVTDGPRAWAPECTYDPTTGKYVVYWSDGVAYSNSTTDFVNFSDRQELFNPGYSVIDGNITSWNGNNYLFFKDERGSNDSSTQNKALKVAKSNSLMPGSFSVITPDYITDHLVEGPAVIKSLTEDKWYLYLLYTRWQMGLFCEH